MTSSAWLLAAFLVSACCACSSDAPAVPAQAGASAPASAPHGQAGDTLARLRALAADTACADDSQCHTLALGASACGGPEAYLPWSSARTPAHVQEGLRALGERYAEERRAAHAASGRMGACRFSPDPGAVCRAGACQLGSPGFQVQ